MSDSPAIVPSQRPSHYVGIGASAGGLEAIDAFFKNMPPDSGCAFIVVQHLSPDHKSLMAELLSKRTEMPVSRATEGMLVEANCVYLIPPNHDLRIFHGKLLLTEQDRHGGINLPIDIFFTSLAEDQGEKAVAIILSGTGSDGTRGIRAIKEKVGMVMVQQEESAAFDGMPRSAIATGLVDYILRPEEMPEHLISYIRHPYAAKNDHSGVLLSDEDNATRIFSLLRERTAVDFTYYKPSTMIRRIERRMSINQMLSLRDYVHYLERYPTEVDTLHRDLLIGVTSFFRDPKAFHELRAKWLPDLLGNAESQPIRLWVAGCSTGEEAYTLGMICQEVLAEIGKRVEVKIFATDVDKEAIASASAGLYPESISADVPPELLSKYFHRRESHFLILRQIREMVVFAQHNVFKDPPFTNISLITCRNMLIYLQPVLQYQVMELFNFSLNPGGFLMLGTSETTGEMTDYFDLLHPKWKLYRSRGRKRRDVLSEQASTFEAAGNRMRQGSLSLAKRLSPVLHEEERIAERLLKGIAARYLPTTLVINEHLELLHTAGEVAPYLRFPSGRMRLEIGKLVHRDLAIPLATGIQKVLKNGDPIDFSSIHLREPDGSGQVVNMHLERLPKAPAQEALVAVFIEARSDKLRTPDNDPLPQAYDPDREAEQRINDLEQELQFTRENLQATVEELETSNEELQATNEELLASYEELQSTNEELQSVNEELYTVNAEHQSKIGELSEVNNDLDNLLNNIRIGTLFLDRQLEIRRFTPEITRFMRILDQDIGRPFAHLSHDLVDTDLDALVQGVRHTGDMVEREVRDRSDSHYLMRIFPYRVGPEFYSGVLLTFVNIDPTKHIQEALLRSEERNRLAQEAANLGSWEWDLATNQLSWSPNIERMFGFAPGGFTKTYSGFLATLHPDDRSRVESEISHCLRDPQHPYQVRHRIVRPDGEIRWMLEHGKVYTDHQGRSVRMIGIVTDITDAHKAEEALRSSERLFRSTLESLDMIAVQLDTQGRIIFANEFLLAFTGWSREELLGSSWFDRCIPQWQRTSVRQVFSSFTQDQPLMARHHKNPILCRDGGLKPVYWNNTPIYDESGAWIGVSSIGRPVSSHS